MSTKSTGVGKSAAARQVLFIQGGGEGTYDEWDDKLVASLRRELGAGHNVRYPRMPNEEDPNFRGGSACLDSAPLVLSGFLPGLSNAGPGDFVAAEGGRSPTAAATKSWRGYAAATNACTPK